MFENCVDALGTHLRPLPLSPTVRRTRGDKETQDWKRVRPVIVTGGGKWMPSDADMARPPAGRGITFRYAMPRKTFAWRLEEAGVGHGAFLGLPGRSSRYTFGAGRKRFSMLVNAIRKLDAH